ncbi:Gfo/Idh/MocA family protein [Planctomonas deserti]|uniref:Gfo/Idh/MocA family protein n=1 Tax=Planctomonas deserti TaxID=2144185 RepID=UPI000D3BA40B|nr:Gfo/Idh/MocA family oxidoreductase [Planctomonas deserti]
MSHLPSPRTPDPRSGPALRWGILAPGAIARDFVTSLRTHTAQLPVAVGSRSLERARSFAAEFGIERAYGSYEELVQDDGLDVVYIAAPHSEHARLALLAIGAGKNVLVEKPLATTATEAAAIASAAREAGVFAMEAMWTRYLPQTDIVRQLLQGGDLGDIRIVTASFGGTASTDPADRINDPALGGGALLDLGVYPVSFAHLVLGAPERVTARGYATATGVDGQSALVLESGSAQALLHTTLFAAPPATAVIAGGTGTITVHPRFWEPAELTVARHGHELAHWKDESGLIGRGALGRSAVAAAIAIGEGRTEEPLHTLDDAIAVLGTIDEARRQLGTF